MLSKVFSAATIGLEGVLIEVEVDVAYRGFPTFTIVGLPNKAVDEAKDRVRTALINSGYAMPDARITVNLAPADIPKAGSSFDLPIALGIAAAAGIIPQESLNSSVFLGELSLQGQVRRVPGTISIALLVQQQQISSMFIPAINASEATIVGETRIYPVETLTQVIQHVNNTKKIPLFKKPSREDHKIALPDYDFADIKGQEQAKRALEIAAAGFHNVHMCGTPGAGKTMLSRAFPGILPVLNQDEVLEVSKMYSAVGQFQEENIFIRPFRSPHHTISRMGLIGGGSYPLPGEISLAHRGVLFLDEFAEFPQQVLEALRQPLEDGVVTVSRAAASVTFPCRFLLLAASNPCPCGYRGHMQKKCICSVGMITKYKKRISGPLLDRIDLHLTISPIDEEKLTSSVQSESSMSIRYRVLNAVERQQKRFKDFAIRFNSEMSASHIKRLCIINEDAQLMLRQAISRLHLSGRAFTRVIKIAQTIADLEGQDRITVSHIAEALQYRAQGQ